MTDPYSHQGDDHPWQVGKVFGLYDWDRFRVVWVCPCGAAKSVRYKTEEEVAS